MNLFRRALVAEAEAVVGIVIPEVTPTMIGEYTINFLRDALNLTEQFPNDGPTQEVSLAFVRNQDGLALLLVRPSRAKGDAWIAVCPRSDEEED